MKRLFLTFIAAMVSTFAAFAYQGVKEVSINVLVHTNGDATITEVWDVSVDEGTEWYLNRENLDGSVISGLIVRDESGLLFNNIGNWDVNRSISQKAGKCGIVSKRNGVELCWGLGTYGHHRYEVQYNLSNAVRSMNDYDCFHFQLVSPGLSASPEYVEVTFELEGVDINTDIARFWAFGFEGEINLVNGVIKAYSTGKFSRNSSVIELVRLEKGYVSPDLKDDRDFQELLDGALKGSSYQDDSDDDWLAVITIFMEGVVIFLLLIRVVMRANGKLTRRQQRKMLGCLPDKVDWSRDLPFDGDLLKTDYVLNAFSSKRKDNALASAMILRMLQYGILSASKDSKGRIEISFNPTADLGVLNTKEKALYDMMKEASGSDLILQNKEFSRWSKKHADKVVEWSSSLKQEGKSQLKLAGISLFSKMSPESVNKVKGVFGFKNYLRDFTIINERKAVEVTLWQDFLVFASLFGIADEVAKELRDIDPTVFDEVVTYDYGTMRDVIFVTNNLSRAITNAAVVQASAAASKGLGGATSFGGGGGFHGGGFGGGAR